jgi:hypothetical protein
LREKTTVGNATGTAFGAPPFTRNRPPPAWPRWILQSDHTHCAGAAKKTVSRKLKAYLTLFDYHKPSLTGAAFQLIRESGHGFSYRFRE